MNYLSHLYLSGNEPAVMAGNFMGDSVKGRAYEGYSSAVRKGILLHRFIDSTTDAHPVNLKTRAILEPYTGKYASVAVDMVYDHYLARNWNVYSKLSLEDYFAQCLEVLNRFTYQFPPRAFSLLTALNQNPWMTRYGSLEGLERSLIGLSNRVKHGNKLPRAVKAIEKNDTVLADNFSRFFPIIKDRVRNEHDVHFPGPPA